MTDRITKLLDTIQKLDREATKGPWVVNGGNDSEYGEFVNLCNVFHNGDTVDIDLVTHVYEDTRSAEFIALSRTALPKLAEALRAVLELHKPETRWSYESVPDYGFSSKDELIEFFDLHHEPHNPDDVTEWQVCIHCAEIEAGAAEDYGHITALWPCKTVQAVTDVLEDDDAA